MPEDPSPADEPPAAPQSGEPLMPADSVLRRIDDDFQLMERRDRRRFWFGRTIDDAFTWGEQIEERAQDQKAAAEGRVRPRRQVTFGPNPYRGPWRERRRELWMVAVLVILWVAAIVVQERVRSG